MVDDTSTDADDASCKGKVISGGNDDDDVKAQPATGNDAAAADEDDIDDDDEMKVLIHVIDGFVIEEAATPFPVR